MANFSPLNTEMASSQHVYLADSQMDICFTHFHGLLNHELAATAFVPSTVFLEQKYGGSLKRSLMGVWSLSPRQDLSLALDLRALFWLRRLNDAQLRVIGERLASAAVFFSFFLPSQWKKMKSLTARGEQ